MRAGLVDIHTHMVPSGDDGVQTIEEAVELCSLAAGRGTTLMYVTPHVNDDLPLSREREQLVRSNAARLGGLLESEGLEVRVGFEVNPTVANREDDLGRYRLDRFDAVLLECPLESGVGYGVDRVFEAAERLEAAGVMPVLAHPERSPGFLAARPAASAAAQHGWQLQVTAASLFGRFGDAVAALAWSLLEAREAELVASDAHRPDRPPFLDEAFTSLGERFGASRAAALLDGSALATASVI